MWLHRPSRLCPLWSLFCWIHWLSFGLKLPCWSRLCSFKNCFPLASSYVTLCNHSHTHPPPPLCIIRCVLPSVCFTLYFAPQEIWHPYAIFLSRKLGTPSGNLRPGIPYRGMYFRHPCMPVIMYLLPIFLGYHAPRANFPRISRSAHFPRISCIMPSLSRKPVSEWIMSPRTLFTGE